MSITNVIPPSKHNQKDKQKKQTLIQRILSPPRNKQKTTKNQTKVQSEIKANKLIQQNKIKSEEETLQNAQIPSAIIKKPKKPVASKIQRKQSRQASLKKFVFKYHSPPPKLNILVHQPTPKDLQTSSIKPISVKPVFTRQIIPPSDLIHQKMKNFNDNPQRYIKNLDSELDNVFKRSKQSIIRQAKVVPVKDWEIRDSTNLLDGYIQ